jgi:hypothetical protein
MTDQAEPSTDAEVQRRLDAILERFPDRFSGEQIAEITIRIRRAINHGSSLSNPKLPNCVGPWFDPRSMAHE